MSFLSPMWLWLLLPWAGVTIWLLWGRRKRANVPFVALWRGAVELPKKRRQLVLPPLALIGLILAMLFAVLAAAKPTAGRSVQRDRTLVIIDRGINMSAAGRYEQVAALAKPILDHA